MPRCLGIDYGLERTGLAVSDPEGKIAFPLTTLTLAGCHNRKNLVDKLASLAADEKIEIIVLGLPLYTDGTENEMCQKVRNFAKRLQRRGDWPIYFEPETLSTETAHCLLARTGSKKISQKIDQAAACLILQAFLDRQKGKPQGAESTF